MKPFPVTIVESVSKSNNKILKKSVFRKPNPQNNKCENGFCGCNETCIPCKERKWEYYANDGSFMTESCKKYFYPVYNFKQTRLSKHFN
jgi:hypothetical protein